MTHSQHKVTSQIRRKFVEGKWTLDQVEEALMMIRADIMEDLRPPEPGDLPKDDNDARAQLQEEARRKQRESDQAEAFFDDFGKRINTFFDQADAAITKFFKKL